jgi:hypothetical protein
MMGGHMAAYFSKSSMACGSSVYWITHVIMMFPFPSGSFDARPGILAAGPNHRCRRDVGSYRTCEKSWWTEARWRSTT